MNNNDRNGGAHRVAVSYSFAFLDGLVALCVSSCGPPTPSVDTMGRLHARIVNVIDGDTLVISIASRQETVRLIGVDTPETKHPTKPVECWGPEAAQFTRSLLPKGTDVVVERDEEARDKYGRLLMYVYRAADNVFVNMQLIDGGWARTLSIPPNTAHESDFDAAARRAEHMHLGLWAHCPR